jgi:alpha-pyrone synthase
MSHIISISTAVPQFAYNQKDLENYYEQATENEDEKRKIRFVGSRSGIERRHSVLPDFGNPDSPLLFHSNGNAGGISKRMEIFESASLSLSRKSVENLPDFDLLKTKITHIITVTCTGLTAPGLDIALARELELSPRIERNSINFMGCNAAVLALKQADSICKSNPDALVLVVCTELCTLHFQKDFSDDYILSNSLFSDGSAAALIGNKKWVPADQNALKIDQFHSLLLHQGKQDMTWQISETGFRINLSSYVSNLICDNMSQMLHDLNISTSDFKHWAIHPGGPKILDDFCLAMNLEKSRLSCSYEVLKNYGNMSSATLLFVLSDLLKIKDLKQPGERIFAAAFGPGLSIESMTLAYV